MPILIVAAFLPEPYNISLPVSLSAGCCLLSMTLGFMLLSGLFHADIYFCLTPYLPWDQNSYHQRSEFFTGAIIPLPFFPESLQTLLYLLPLLPFKHAFSDS